MMQLDQPIEIAKTTLVILCGPSAAGKSTWARRRFQDTQIVSSDHCRAMISDDPLDQTVSGAAFELFYSIIEKRLAYNRLTVADATSLTRDARKRLQQIARHADFQSVVVIFDIPLRLLQERDAGRAQPVGVPVVRRHSAMLQQSIQEVRKEGFNRIYILSPEDLSSSEVQIVPLPVEKPAEHGPFDVIGDIHGCLNELTELLERLGYSQQDGVYRHPAGRKAVFLGDLGDRGPASIECFRLVMAMQAAGSAFYVPGNHCNKLMRALAGRRVTIGHGLQKTLDELAALPEEEREHLAAQIYDFIDMAPPYLLLDNGKLVVAHAGIRADMIGKLSQRISDFCLYGDVSGETDAEGHPMRREWARDYRGKALVVYGHQVHPDIAFVNNTINIDQGCVFGGMLTAFRYPEKETVSVQARHVYAQGDNPVQAELRRKRNDRPAISQSGGAQPEAQKAGAESEAGFLNWVALTQGLTVSTALAGKIQISNERASQALGVLASEGIDPRWLIYLPPEQSPPEPSPLDTYLEHPAEVYAYFRACGLNRCIIEEKQMGARAIVIVCRDDEVAGRIFGIAAPGAVYTCTGQPFFTHGSEIEVVRRLQTELQLYFKRHTIDWLALDVEILPWNLSMHDTLARQLAETGAGGNLARSPALNALAQAELANIPVGALYTEMRGLHANAQTYEVAYQDYVQHGDQLAIAPYFILAQGQRSCWEHDHRWHMAQATELATLSSLIVVPDYRVVVLGNEQIEPGEVSEMQATQFWLERTEAGAEGIICKPLAALPLELPETASHMEGRWVQPALRCRGREYLRLIYGMDYTEPGVLARLKHRTLAAKRRNILAELALGHEALHRFLAGEPLSRYYECIVALLALQADSGEPQL